MVVSKPIATPIEQNHRLSEALGEKKEDKKNVSKACWETHLSCTY